MPSIAEIKLIVLGVMLLGTAFFSAYVTHEVDSAHLLRIEAQYQQAVQKAEEAAMTKQQLQDQLKNQQALEAASHQQLLTKQTQDRLDEVSKVLKVATQHCITNGIVRLLNNSALGNPTSQLPAATGKSDAACTTTTSDTVLRTLIRNNGIARQNAQQLNDLIGSIKQLQDK